LRKQLEGERDATPTLGFKNVRRVMDRPMLPATVEPATPKEATAKPPTWPEVPRDPIEEEMRRRENRRLDLPPIDPAETPHQAEMRRQEEMRRDRKRFGPTLPPIDLR